MRRDGRRFLFFIVVTGGAVAALVYTQRLMAALIAGAIGLLLHGMQSTSSSDDVESADSSYFFGFLLTLIFLVTGLASLGARSTGQLGPAEILGFLRELGAGLALTIVGLIVRQVRTLSAPPPIELEFVDPLEDTNAQLADAVRELTLHLQGRPEAIAAAELNETRVRARQAAEQLEQTVVRSAGRVEESMRKLEEATTQVSSALVRAGSGMGEAVTGSVERFQVEVRAVLGMLEAQRRHFDESLRLAQAQTEEARSQMTEQLQAQSRAWRATLVASQNHLAAAHDSLDGEYQRGLASLTAAGNTFHELAVRVGSDIEALPNPAERLVGLWDGVRTLESTLVASMTGTSEQLIALTRRSQELSRALAALEQSSTSAAGAVENSASSLARSLRDELTQIDGILDEYTKLFRRKLPAS